MSYCFIPSLQSMAATKIVTVLWSRADILDLIDRYLRSDERCRGKRWRKMEERVDEKVSSLRQPEPLEEEISSVVIPIGDEIRNWLAHVEGFGFKNIPREFCCTSLGILDKKRTAEVFVRDLTLPKGERYAMACLYCIEWDKPIPIHRKVSPQLGQYLAYWTYDKTGDAGRLDREIGRDPSKTPYQRAFHYAVSWGNTVAAGYYSRKLTSGERKDLLSNVQLHHSMLQFDTYRFLLSLMDERQQWNLLEKYFFYVLMSLLERPWQPLFMDVARRVSDVLKKHVSYDMFLSEMVRKIQDGYEDYNYEELFGAFWVQVPVDYKKDLIFNSSLLLELSEVRDVENISMMLEETSPEEREQILLSEVGFSVCESLAEDEEWDALKTFICDFLSSRNKMIHFKKECRKRAETLGNRKLRHWIDGLIEKKGGKKKNCPVPPKRLCR